MTRRGAIALISIGILALAGCSGSSDPTTAKVPTAEPSQITVQQACDQLVKLKEVASKEPDAGVRFYAYQSQIELWGSQIPAELRSELTKLDGTVSIAAAGSDGSAQDDLDQATRNLDRERALIAVFDKCRELGAIPS